MGSISILLADDSITIQKVVGIIFGSDDYSLTIVTNGNDAVQKARELKPDVMLIDAQMPGINGYAVCEQIRKDPVLSSSPILLMTGAFEQADPEKLKQCGADENIVKPFESQQIVSKVQELYQLGLNRKSALKTDTASVVPDTPKTVAAGSDDPFVLEPTAFAPAFEPLGTTEPDFGFNLEPEQPIISNTTVVEAVQVSPFDIPEPEQPAISNSPKAEAVPVSPFDIPSQGIESATHLDDPWGAFTQSPVETAGSFESAFDQPDVMALMNEDSSLPSIQEQNKNNVGTSWVPADVEDTFVFIDELANAPEQLVKSAIAETNPPEPVPPFNPDVFEQVAAVEPVIEKVADLPSGAVNPLAAAMSAAPTVTQSVAGLTEEQVRDILLSASKETIERIVWEVVPDLAEAMIKEAIKRITEGK